MNTDCLFSFFCCGCVYLDLFFLNYSPLFWCRCIYQILSPHYFRVWKHVFILFIFDKSIQFYTRTNILYIILFDICAYGSTRLCVCVCVMTRSSVHVPAFESNQIYFMLLALLRGKVERDRRQSANDRTWESKTFDVIHRRAEHIAHSVYIDYIIHTARGVKAWRRYDTERVYRKLPSMNISRIEWILIHVYIET